MLERTISVTIRHDSSVKPRAHDCAEAVALLNRGNQKYAAITEGGSGEVLMGTEAFGLSREPGVTLPQEPFAAALGCSDARVPLEQVLGGFANDIFVARVAGNVLGGDVVGSLSYAIAHFPSSLQVVVALGHTHCGAVTAAVDAVLDPATYLRLQGNLPLRGIVDAIVPAATTAQAALSAVFGAEVKDREGYRQALIEVAVVCNAAFSAVALAKNLEKDVVFGVYDLDTRLVGLPGGKEGLVPAPSPQTLEEILIAACHSSFGE